MPPTEAVLDRIGERDHFAAIVSWRVDPRAFVGGGFNGVVTPVNRAGGIVLDTGRPLPGRLELKVAPELVIIVADVLCQPPEAR